MSDELEETEIPELSFEDQLTAEFEPPAEEPPEADDQPEEEPEASDPSAEPEAPPPAEPAAEFVSFGDLKLSAQEAQGLQSVYGWIQQNPEQFINYLKVIEGQAQVVPVGQPQPQVEAESDEYVDPQIVALRQEMGQLRSGYEQFQQYQAWQASQQAAYVANKAMTDFAAERGLSDTEMKALESQAAVVVNGLRVRQPTIPPAEAARIGLEQAYWANEDYREREFNRRAEQQKTDQKRQRKLAGVSGTSGSVPKDKPAPQTQTERREAMIADIAQAMTGE